MRKEFIKKFLCSISFIVGIIIGYILGIFNFGLKTVIYFWGNLENLLSPLTNFTPTTNFLSDVAAFNAVVIALAIPLSLEIVSRISERYKSEVIVKKFSQEWEIKWLPILLILNIIFVVALRFFINDNPTSILWKILAWMAFVGFLFIAIILSRFFLKLKRYITETEFILDKLFNEAERLLK